MDVKVETPASPAVEQSIDEIVTAALAEAEKTGTPVVTEGETKPAETPAPAAAAPATETPAAEEPAGDDISAARARQILAKVEERVAAVEAREAELTARESAGLRSMLSELLKAPKAFLAKHGAHIDDLIDASVAEGKVEAPAETDDNPRLTAIERRLEQKEADEKAAENQRLIDDKIAAIQRDVKANPKFTAINEGDRAGLVTGFMLDYHREHGKAISWDKAAAMVEADLRGLVEKVAPKLGWAKAEAAKPAAAPTARAGTTSIGGSQSEAASSEDELPEDPTVLMDFLVKRATNGLLKTA